MFECPGNDCPFLYFEFVCEICIRKKKVILTVGIQSRRDVPSKGRSLSVRFRLSPLLWRLYLWWSSGFDSNRKCVLPYSRLRFWRIWQISYRKGGNTRTAPLYNDRVPWRRSSTFRSVLGSWVRTRVSKILLYPRPGNRCDPRGLKTP